MHAVIIDYGRWGLLQGRKLQFDLEAPSRPPQDTCLTYLCCAQALLSLVTVLLVGQCAAQAVTDADIYNFALNLEYLEVRLGPAVRCSAWFPDQHCAIALRQLVAIWFISTVHTLWLVLGRQAGNSREGVGYSCPQLVLQGLALSCRLFAGQLLPLWCLWNSHHKQSWWPRPNWLHNGRLLRRCPQPVCGASHGGNGPCDWHPDIPW